MRPSFSDIISYRQLIVSEYALFATLLAVIVAAIAAYFAYKIGKKQNEINEESLTIANFVEVFFMPQVQHIQDEAGKIIGLKYAVLVKNASSYPIYLNNYTLNNVKQHVGDSVIPNNHDSWYTVPIPHDVQSNGEFQLQVYFESFIGKKYTAEAVGKFDGLAWGVISKKRIQL